jgi:hypothetical protein
MNSDIIGMGMKFMFYEFRVQQDGFLAHIAPSPGSAG